MLSVGSMLACLLSKTKLITSGCPNQKLFSSMPSQGRLLEMVKSLIPPLTFSQHKGESGRIGIIGGCQEYTGAPYFAAISALKIGADLSHVFCTGDSASVIKSYSPELIVHPILERASAPTEVSEWLPRLHAVVVGPGMGRNETIISNVRSIINQVMARKIPLVIDADGLFLVTQDPSIISGYDRCILTPNVVEFSRLYEKVIGGKATSPEPGHDVKTLSERLGYVTIVQKGQMDIISDGRQVLVCSSQGGPRRCGGQGDLLSGTMGTFTYWAQQQYSGDPAHICPELKQYGPTLAGAYAACMLTRECNRRAFQQMGRSMTTTDMIQELPSAFDSLFL